MQRFSGIVKQAKAVSDLTPLQKLVDSHRSSTKCPAVIAGFFRLVKSDKDPNVKAEIGCAAAGLRNVNHPSIEVTENDKFKLSCSKALIALTIQQILEKDETISWNTTIGEKFKDINPRWESISLLELISHRAGIIDTNYLLGIRDGAVSKIIDYSKIAAKQIIKGAHNNNSKLLERFYKNEENYKDLPIEERIKNTRQKPIHEFLVTNYPNSSYYNKFLASNIGYSIAISMIEIHCNKPFELLIKENVTDPIGVTSFNFGGAPALDDIDNISQPYGHYNSGFFGLKPMPVHPLDDRVPDFYSPFSGLHGSMNDWLKTVGLQLLLAREPSIPVIYSSLASMTKSLGYGGGWVISRKTKPISENLYGNLAINSNTEKKVSYFHDGNTTCWTSVAAMDLETGVAVSVATNIYYPLLANSQLMKLAGEVFRVAEQQSFGEKTEGILQIDGEQKIDQSFK